MTEPNAEHVTQRYLIYAAAVSVLTVLIFTPYLPGGWLDVWMFLLLTLVTESASVSFLRLRSTMSVSFALVHASVLLFEPVGAAWIAALGTVRQIDVRGAVPLRLVIYNRLQLAAAAFTASYAFRALGGDLSSFASRETLLAGVVSGTTYYLINTGAMLVSFVTVQRVSGWWHVFTSGLRWVTANWIAVMPISYLMAVTYQQLNIISVVFYALPLMVARQSFQMYVEIRKQYLDTIRSLAAALEAKDPYTFGHTERVARMAVQVGRALKLGQEDLESLEVAAILHDVGKIGISDTILRKTERFTDDDFREMMKHPIIGARIVRNIGSLDRVAGWVRHHHERMDGKGYPDRLLEKDIPIGARIIAVVDAFDAMTSARPYRRTLSVAEAMGELERCSGTQFAGQVVAAFRRVTDDGARLEEILAGASDLTEELLRGLEDEIPRREPEQAAEVVSGGRR